MTSDFQPLWEDPGVTTTSVGTTDNQASSGPSTNYETGRSNTNDLATSPVDQIGMSKEDIELALQILNLLLFAWMVYHKVQNE